jgi:hypothetical protein
MQRAMPHYPRGLKNTENKKQQQGESDRNQDRAETAQAVGKKEKHRDFLLKMASSADASAAL